MRLLSLFVGILFALTYISTLQAGPLDQGVSAFNAGDYNKALKYWQPLAKNNHPDALYNIGLLYMKGHGVEQNYIQAKEYFKQAAFYGSADAAYNLGVLYKRGKVGHPSSKTAIYWWKQAAEQGHADSQFNYGVMLAYGNGLKKDVPAALQWWNKAAAQGHQDAIQTLVRTYEEGLFDVAKDPAQVQRWRRYLK